MKGQHVNHLLELSLATLFISSSGVLGKYIAMPTPVIIWWRSIIGFIVLLLLCKILKVNLKVKDKRDLKRFVLSALFLGAHWITYFYALKLSNVAIGMLSLYTFPIITSLLEPLFLKSKWDIIHFILGGMVLCGIYILSPEINLESQYFQGILLGILSAVCYSIRILILKRDVAHYNGIMLMLYQVFVLSVVLAPVLLFMDTSGISTQYPYVFLLGVLTTAIGHTLFVKSLKYFSASTASIITSVLPVYGIVLAYFFLNEVPEFNTYIGGLLIVSTVVIESIRSSRSK